MRLNPFHPERFWFHLARAQFVARRYAEAIEALSRLSAPDAMHHALLAACHARLGDAAATASHAREVLRRLPNFSIGIHCLPLLHYRHAEDLEHHRESLRLAGLPG
jgi:adenylate cyclase